jgi:hypothetical protein
MLGKIEYWSSDQRKKGYGIICVRHEHGILEKFFALGSRLLFDTRPQIGDAVEFDVTNEPPKRDHGYPLATNIRLVTPLGFVTPAPSLDITPLISSAKGGE